MNVNCVQASEAESTSSSSTARMRDYEGTMTSSTMCPVKGLQRVKVVHRDTILVVPYAMLRCHDGMLFASTVWYLMACWFVLVVLKDTAAWKRRQASTGQRAT